MSNLKFITVTINNHMRKEPEKHARFREVFCSTNATFWEQMTPAIADNYITRCARFARNTYRSDGLRLLHVL